MGYKKEIKIKKKVYPFSINDNHYYVMALWNNLGGKPWGIIPNLTPLSKEEAELELEKYIKNSPRSYNPPTYSVVNEREAMLSSVYKVTSLYENLDITFYKGDLNWCLSGVDFFAPHSKQALQNVCHILRWFVNKKRKIYINPKFKNNVFYSALIFFCETEGIDWTRGLEIETILKDNGDVDMIVNEIKLHGE